MPGAPAPWVDAWAPTQYVYGSGGASGPLRSPDADLQTTGTTGGLMNTDSYDGTLHLKVAGTMFLAAVVILILQATGFRFVVAANAGFGG